MDTENVDTAKAAEKSAPATGDVPSGSSRARYSAGVRRMPNNIVQIVIIAVLAIAVVILAWLLFASGSGGAAAKVGKTVISEQSVTSSIESLRAAEGLQDEAAWSQYLTENDLTPSAVRRQIIESMEGDAILESAASGIGVSVSDNEVNEEIKQDKESFASEDAFNEYLKNEGLDQNSYKQQVKASLLQAKVTDKLNGDSNQNASMSDEEIIAAINEEYPEGGTLKHVYQLTFSMDDADQKALADAVTSGQKSFNDAAAELFDSLEDASIGWVDNESLDEETAAALASLPENKVSGLIDNGDGTSSIVMWSGQYTLKTPITSLEGIPQDLKDSFSSASQTSAAIDKYTAWINEALNKVDVTVYAMPSGLPYDVKK